MADEVKVKMITVFVLAGFAAGGNYLRVAAPPEAGPLGLDRVQIKSAETGAPEPFAEEVLDPGFLETLRAREVVFRTYESATGEPVWLFMGYFDAQKEGSQVHSPKHCYPGSGWNIESERTVPAPWGKGNVESLVVGNGYAKQLVHYWFQTGDGYLSGVFELKLKLTKNAVFRKPQDVVFVRISTPLDGDRGSAEERLRPFALDVKKGVERLFLMRDEPEGRSHRLNSGDQPKG